MTLAEYAALKSLPLDFLRSLDLSDGNFAGRPAVRTLYRDEAGCVRATRYRIAAEGDRFRWKTGDRARLYGLWRLQDARDRGFIILVEGESDVQTLWYHGFPAIGLHGAGTWNEVRDAACFDEISTIFVVREPDQGGDTLIGRLSQSSISDRIRVVDLAPFKDHSELQLAVGSAFPLVFAARLDDAQPYAAMLETLRKREGDEAWAVCKDIAESADILADVEATVAALGLTGESRNVRLLFLALVSRRFDRPVSVVLKGPSSAGKSYAVESVLQLFPSSTYHALTAMSERSLAYSDESLAHRFLVIYEAAGVESETASYLLRSLLSEGCIRYETVESTADGLKPRLIERAGPTGVILTTTKVSLHPENETRMLSLQATDTPAHTRAVLQALGQRAAGSHLDAEIDLSRWHAFQVWLESGEHRVVVPYAPALADLIPPSAVRLRRDFSLLIALIQAHALVHRASRSQDAEGGILATLDDYRAVRELVADLLADGVEAAVPAPVRQTVDTLRAVLKERRDQRVDDPAISITQLAQKLGLEKSSASRRVQQAIERGYIVNQETAKGKPARLVLGDPMPNEVDVLPAVEVLRRCTATGGESGGVLDAVGTLAFPDTEAEAPEPIWGDVVLEPGEWRCEACGRRVDNSLTECVDCGQPRSGSTGDDDV